MIHKFLKIAILASLKAGEVIMEVYNKDNFNIEIKSDKSPLTEADKKANDVINSHLKSTSIPIISEENKQIDYEVRRKWDECWIVDPVDGTKEFIKRNGEFTVNIAFVKQGTPIFGVIYVPEKKILYYGDVNKKKAFKVTLEFHEASIEEIIAKSEAIRVNEDKSNTIRIVGSRSHMNQETVGFIDSLKDKDYEIEIVAKGSSLKFCLIAEGVADIYPRFAPTMEWDTAAGQAICKASGAEVISLETDRPLLYNKENLLNSWFKVCANEEESV